MIFNYRRNLNKWLRQVEYSYIRSFITGSVLGSKKYKRQEETKSDSEKPVSNNLVKGRHEGIWRSTKRKRRISCHETLRRIGFESREENEQTASWLTWHRQPNWKDFRDTLSHVCICMREKKPLFKRPLEAAGVETAKSSIQDIWTTDCAVEPLITQTITN